MDAPREPDVRGFMLGGILVLLPLAAAALGTRVAVSPELAYSAGFCWLSALIASFAAWLGQHLPALTDRIVRQRWRFVALSAPLLLSAFLAHGQPITFGLALQIDGAILMLGGALGSQLGRRIEIAGHVLAVALVSALVDSWSVFDSAAPTAQIAGEIMREPTRASAFVTWAPMLGSGELAPLIGAGDVVFAGLYGAALARHGVAPLRTGCALFAGFIAGMIATLLAQRALPLLPFLGAAVLCTDRRLSSLAPRDRRTLLISVGVLAVWVASRIAR